MLTKGAIGNLVNRYRAVLKKCNLINTFGSLAVASMLVLGGAGVAEAVDVSGELNTSTSGVTSASNVTFVAGNKATHDVFVDSNQKTHIVPFIRIDKDITLNGGLATGENSYATLESLSVDENGTISIIGAKFNGGAMANVESYNVDSGAIAQFNISGVHTAKSFSIENSNFSNFHVTDSSESGAYGGAVGLMKTTSVNLANVTLSNNSITSTKGYSQGGAYHQAGGTLTANNIILSKNRAIGYKQAMGGAMVLNGVNATIQNSTFSENAAIDSTGAPRGGAIYLYGNTTLTISDSIFENNFVQGNEGTSSSGGAISLGSGHSLSVTGVTFNGNEARSTSNGGLGGAIYNGGGAVTIGDGNTFTNNHADGFGGAIYNKGNITLSGTNVFSGNTDSTGANDIHNLGTLTINGEATFDGGISGDGTVNGSGTIVVNDKAATFTGDAADTLKVKGSAKLNDQTGGDLAALKAQVAGLGIDTVTGMDEGLISGAVDANGNQKVNTVMQDTLDLATAAPLAVGRIVMNDVRKRMGDLRSAPGEAGVWMRWDGGKLKGDAGLTNDFNTIQVGGDHKVGKNCRFGVAAAFTHGDLDHSNGNGEMETYSFSAYSTWMGDNGMFADVIARVGFTKSEISMKGQTIDLDNEALSLSAEYGWRFDLCKQFYVEPQVELTYTYLTEADSEVSYATYKTDSVDSLIGRAGLAAGWKLPNEMGDIYARASVVQEFLGDTRITGSAFGRSVPHSLDGQDTWLEYGIGANIKLTDKTYIWADVERTEGADIDEEWRGTVGIRYSF